MTNINKYRNGKNGIGSPNLFLRVKRLGKLILFEGLSLIFSDNSSLRTFINTN